MENLVTHKLRRAKTKPNHRRTLCVPSFGGTRLIGHDLIRDSYTQLGIYNNPLGDSSILHSSPTFHRQDQVTRPAMNCKVFCLFAIALIVGSFSSAHGQAALTERQCQVQPVARVNCGEPGITATECFNKGCCYDSLDPNAIWCFYARPDDGKINVRGYKIPPGPLLRTEKMEMNRRLCWVLALVVVLAATSNAQAPTADQCAVLPKARTNCGYPGISATACNNKGCCFDNKLSGVVWCFYPADEVLIGEKRNGEEPLKLAEQDTPPLTHCLIWLYGREEELEQGCSIAVGPTSSRITMGYRALILLTVILVLGHETCAKRGSHSHSGSHSSSEEDGVISRRDCSAAPYARRDCGYPTISASECAQRRCCYDSSIPGINWCYFSKEQDQAQCTIRTKDRKDCGHHGISANDCYLRGCCFDDSKPEVKWCYYPKFIGCSVSHKLRKDCGYPNISAKDCHSRGCCYDSSIPDTVWCFYGYK
ncbi:uncharacterized protein [Engystomops pustulosus]|uniref:uncharacterized protein n=1 Tax=Engystomops pustulosus TaxID=76066 RepID=UPI003AFAFEA2